MRMALAPTRSSGERWCTVLASVALVTVVVAVYSPVREYAFINLDDNEYVTENPFVRTGISAENVHWALTAFHSGHWHPLTWLPCSDSWLT